MIILEAIVMLLGYLVPFFLLMGIVVTVHEWGHYHAARIIGVRASEFAIGMGPTIWGATDKDGCRWQIKLLPVGGYVRFQGADADTPANDRSTFDRRTPGDRAFVLAAGPALNLLFGMIVIAALYATSGRPYLPPVVTSVVAEMPAGRAGLLAGDQILSVNGIETKDFAAIVEEISMHPDGRIEMVVEREGSTRVLDMVADRVMVDSFGVQQAVGKVGISSAGPMLYRQVGPAEAIATGAGDVLKMTRSMGIALYQMATGKRSLQEMGGPVRIAEISGEAIRINLQFFVFLIAAISINLGIMNLLPLPVLDGGQLVICAIEKLMGRPIGARALGYMYKASFACVIGCMLALTFNDIVGIVVRI